MDVRKLAKSIIDRLKKSSLVVEKPYDMEGNETIPILQAFGNEYTMFLVMIAGIDKHIHPVSALESNYIMDTARVRMNVDTMNYVLELKKMERGSDFFKHVPVSFKTIIRYYEDMGGLYAIHGICDGFDTD